MIKTFLIVIIFCALYSFSNSTKQQATFHNSIIDSCPDAGLSSNPYKKQENSFKNRECIQKEITKEFSVDTVENVDVSDTDYVRVIGYLVRYKWEGQESCNCYSHEKKEHDEHIYLCSDPDDQNLANTVVCEITRKASPELRAMNMHELIGKMVAVEGYAFIDPDHTNAKWRKTAFEVHPVVDIKVLN